MQDAAQQSGRLELYQEGRDAAHQRQIKLVRDLRHAAERGELDGIIEPVETRDVMGLLLDLASRTAPRPTPFGIFRF